MSLRSTVYSVTPKDTADDDTARSPDICVCTTVHEEPILHILSQSCPGRSCYPHSTIMSHTPSATDPNSRFQSILDEALRAYKNTTGKDLPSHPLFLDLTSCESPASILTALQKQLPWYDQPGTSRDTSTKSPWLDTTVDVISQVLQTIGAGAGVVCPPNLNLFLLAIGKDHRSDSYRCILQQGSYLVVSASSSQ
jgi:hypothetical protein